MQFARLWLNVASMEDCGRDEFVNRDMIMRRLGRREEERSDVSWNILESGCGCRDACGQRSQAKLFGFAVVKREVWLS